MAKKTKKADGWKRYLPFMLVGGGAAIVIFGQKWFDSATDKFVAGIGYKFSNLKLKLSGLNLRVTAIMTITNTNSLGGKVNSFTGSLKFGEGGQQIVPVNVAQFNLPPNGSVNADIVSQISLLQLAGNIQTVVQSIVGGDLRKLHLSGILDTTFARIPIETEITPLKG